LGYDDAVWPGKSPDTTLSNAAENVFPDATVPALLRVNHERNGRAARRTDSDDGIRGKATLGCVSLKNQFCTKDTFQLASMYG